MQHPHFGYLENCRFSDMLLVILLYSTIHLACSSNNLTTTPSAGLIRQLNRPLCDIGCKCPEKGQVLMLLDCSQAGITTLPNALVIESTYISLSFKNNRLKTVAMGTFVRADEVQQLDLSVNIINKLDSYAFAAFMSLTQLVLSHNQLSAVSRGMLNGLWNLRLLELGHNNIENISPSSFEVTPNLQELRLHFNPLFQLPEDVFRFLPKLEKLDLQDTGLVMLPSNVFRPTPRLHWLSLATNAFENVPDEALSQAPRLETLDLSENDFTVLLEGTFKRLPNISALYLNSLDRLTRIEKNALAGLTKLKCLYCSYNSKLDYIDENVFGSGPSNTSEIRTPPREKLYLRENALRTLKSPIDVESWPSLTFVDLADNPWKCDCNLKWMMFLTKEAQVNIRCDSPRRLRGRTFDTLDPSELTCGGNWPLATFALIVACMIGFAAIMLAVSAVVCSRTRLGLYIRAKQQFSYDKVKPKKEIESVDLEWDPSADM